MQIGDIIRKYRKNKCMTQEEMALRLGVTAPAVNKWENHVSLPDIMLLAPIARLLDISLDTLLQFHENLTAEEINHIAVNLNNRLKSLPYDEAFQWAKEQLEQYPNCQPLMLRLAVLLDAWQLTHDVGNSEKYEQYIKNCYIHALKSEAEDIRSMAADSLFGFYSRKEQYEEAEKYLSYFSVENPERKRKQAMIYGKTNRLEEGWKAYEELLFSGYQQINMVFYGMYQLAMQENSQKKAHMLVEKQSQLADVFDMGEYYKSSCRLELAAAKKDADATREIMERMLAAIDQISIYSQSPLYEHMDFQEMSPEFLKELKKNLLNCFHDEETFGFLNISTQGENECTTEPTTIPR